MDIPNYVTRAPILYASKIEATASCSSFLTDAAACRHPGSVPLSVESTRWRDDVKNA